jgi:hypothetical protein
VLTWQAPDGAELALLSGDAQGPNGEPLTVIAGKVLTERNRCSPVIACACTWPSGSVRCWRSRWGWCCCAVACNRCAS